MTFLVKFFPFILAWAFVKGSIRKDKIIFLQQSPGEENEILLIMTWTENEEDMTAGCEIFNDKRLINETLASDDTQIRTLTKYEMQILLGDCKELLHQRRKRDTDNGESAEISIHEMESDYDELTRTNRRRTNERRGSRSRTPTKRIKEARPKLNKARTTDSPSATTSLNEIADEYDKMNEHNGTSANSEIEHESGEHFNTTVTTVEPVTTHGYDGLPIIFPGTRWCGAGDIAENYDDLGPYEDTDRCCRAHDLCNDTLAPGETRHNLTNTSPFTKLCCQCDEEFFKCLDDVRSTPANTIGNMYFNLLRRECYKKDYPSSNTCIKHLTFFKLTCLEYEKDTNKEKVYQWIRPKRFPRI